jgi:glutaredoxin-like protein
MIREQMKKLTKPVNLKVFIDRNKEPQNYDYTMSILRDYTENSNGLLTVEEFQIGETPDLEKKYNIKRTPTILFINDQEEELIRYLSAPQGSEIQPFIQSLLVFAGAPNYYEKAIKENLEKIDSSIISVMITNSCAYCPQVVNIVSQFALASEGKIKVVIVDIMENPDIGEKYDAESVPFIIVNNKKPLIGMHGPEEILNKIMESN